MNGKILVTSFSASGVTADVARELAQAIGADLCEIAPVQPYSSADLDWTNKKSRSTLEMQDPASRPAMKPLTVDPAQYDTIFVGFPIWWYVEPRIVDTFLDGVALEGKTVIPFATSGGSGMGRTVDVLKGVCPAARFLPGKRMDSDASAEEVTAWVKSLGV